MGRPAAVRVRCPAKINLGLWILGRREDGYHEVDTILQAVALEDADKIAEEFGDLSFSLINYARFLRIDAENALERTNKKFISRFTRMEEEARLQGRSLAGMTLAEMDDLWNAIKRSTADKQQKQGD